MVSIYTNILPQSILKQEHIIWENSVKSIYGTDVPLGWSPASFADAVRAHHAIFRAGLRDESKEFLNITDGYRHEHILLISTHITTLSYS